MAAHRFSAEMVERLRHLAGRGYPAPAIAAAIAPLAKLPVTAQSVRVKACELGIRLKRRDPKYKSEVRFPVSLDVWAIRLKHANRRGLSVAQFVRLFVEVAVDERLIYKILDEDRPRSRKPRPAGAPLMGRPRKMKEAAVAAS